MPLSHFIKPEAMVAPFGMNSMKCELKDLETPECADRTLGAVASWRRDRWEGQCVLAPHKLGQVVLNP